MSIVFTVKRRRNLPNMAASQKLEWDDRLAAYSENIILAMQVEIETPKWFRGGPAMRWGSGGLQSSPAVDDLVDTGGLRDSFSVVVAPARYGTSFEVVSSNAEINLIRFGYMSKRSAASKAKPKTKFHSRWIEGRDFVRSALEAYPPKYILKRAGRLEGTKLGRTFSATAPASRNSLYAAYDADIFG
jgi:hypothetical protein